MAIGQEMFEDGEGLGAEFVLLAVPVEGEQGRVELDCRFFDDFGGIS